MGKPPPPYPMLFITMAHNGQYLVPEHGIWADTTEARAKHRVRSLNLPGSWLRDGGMRAVCLGGYAPYPPYVLEQPAPRKRKAKRK